VSGQTVREEGTDRSKMLPNLQCCTEKNGPSVMDPRTVRLVTDRPTLKREALKNPHEHEEQLGYQAPRERSAVTSRTVHQVRISTAEEHEKQPQTSNRWIS
jgi:hypothetical protein